MSEGRISVTVGDTDVAGEPVHDTSRTTSISTNVKKDSAKDLCRCSVIFLPAQTGIHGFVIELDNVPCLYDTPPGVDWQIGGPRSLFINPLLTCWIAGFRCETLKYV